MITVQVDSFAGSLSELCELFPQHWQQLALWQDRMPLRPQLSEYVRREEAGELVLVTVRRDGRLVAYYTAHVRPGFHYGETLTGTMDMMFIVPEAVGRGLSKPLLECVETELRRRGVQVWYSGWKTNKPQGMNRLHRLFGFEPADTYVTKWIGDHDQT